MIIDPLAPRFGLSPNEMRAFNAWLTNHYRQGYCIQADDTEQTVTILDPNGRVIAKHRINDFKSSRETPDP